MSENITRKKHTGEPGNGGQFGATQRSEPSDASLSPVVADEPVGSPVYLPMETAWPESLPKPTFEAGYSDSGEPMTTLYIPGHGDAYLQGDGDLGTDYYETSGLEIDPMSGEFDQVADYVQELHDRHVLKEAYYATGDVSGLRDRALGRRLGIMPPEDSAIDVSVRRIENIFNAIGTSGEDDETDLADLLTDLRHYANARGLNLYAAQDRAREMFNAELEDPMI